MAATFHTFEISARNANRMVREAGLDAGPEGAALTLPVNLLALKRVVARLAPDAFAAVRIGNRLEKLVAELFEFRLEAGLKVTPLRLPDSLDTLSAALDVSDAQGHGVIGSRERGTATAWNRIQIERMLTRADLRGGRTGAFVSEGFRLLARSEPERLPKLMASLEKGHTDSVINALVEYEAAATRARDRAALDAAEAAGE